MQEKTVPQFKRSDMHEYFSKRTCFGSIKESTIR